MKIENERGRTERNGENSDTQLQRTDNKVDLETDVKM